MTCAVEHVQLRLFLDTGVSGGAEEEAGDDSAGQVGCWPDP